MDKKEYNRLYRLKNKKKLIAYSRKYYKKNKDKWFENQKIVSNEWYFKNRERNKIQRAEYYQRVKKERTRKHREQYRNDPKFRLTERLRGRLRDAIYDCRKKNNGLGEKKDKTLNLLGCTVDFLMKYLEPKFSQSMTWDNYGVVWHVDHIKPVSLFDLLLEEEQRKCFHYTNLQPMLASDNLSKGAKFRDL